MKIREALNIIKETIEPEMEAVVHFRTIPNGSYKYMSGLTRGFWRVLLVHNPKGSLAINSSNVLASLYESPVGINGVTEKSKYYIGNYYIYARNIADRVNGLLMSGLHITVDDIIKDLRTAQKESPTIFD
jgi:hypothetical protein